VVNTVPPAPAPANYDPHGQREFRTYGPQENPAGRFCS
jgi:hypothetical protein